jgi:uncharacterized protein YbbC (DUF1343 family)/CubicO group peptidase (beta-lactamase class C family)
MVAPGVQFLASAAEVSPAFKAATLGEVDAAMNHAIAEKKLPGGVVWIERNGQAFHKAYGNRALQPKVESATEDTIFDAASLTKVMATAPAIMLLLERGHLKLEDKVSRQLPEFRGGGTENITLRHLLTHTSGLRASLPPKPEWSGYESAIALACAEIPTNAPDTVFRYSDVNFILLGEVVQRVSGRKLDEFAAAEIFQPLKMKDTLYLPKAGHLSRIAPTEHVTEGMLRGKVHDPTARRMGGVAGHAGVFTTASDLARFARMILHEGELDGVRLFKPQTIQLMTSVQSAELVLSRRGLGWDIDSPYSRPRGELFPLGSFGHTGWTGAALWIDPFSRTFWILLSNRVHPDGKGNTLPLYFALGTLAAEAVENFNFAHVAGALPFRTNFLASLSSTNAALNATAANASRGRSETNSGMRRRGVVPGVLNGIDELVKQHFAPLRKLRVGLITNHTGTDRERNPTIDLLFHAPEVQLKALFSPEHGLRGLQDEDVASGIDEPTGLPVHSLYPRIPKKTQQQTESEYNAMAMKLRSPTPEQLAGLDALVFDIQDIGCRFYTYIATLGNGLEAASGAKLKFFVLDRANPINGVEVEGPVYRGEPAFVAYHRLPLRHGMTVGELARMFNAERGWNADLTVIPCEGWKREMWFDATELPWINPSPNMRTLNAAALYPGIGLHETALSVGRGTERPFEILGAPYIDDLRLAWELNKTKLPGVAFIPIRFTPKASTFANEDCGGVAIQITDRSGLRPVEIGIVIALTLHRLYPDDYALDKLQPLLRDEATLDAIKSGETFAEIKRLWSADLAQFKKRREPFLIYK